MKNTLFLLVIFFSLSISTFAQNPWWWWFDDEDEILSEVKNYAERVKSENGIISEISNLNNQLKQIKSHHYLDSLLFWVTSIGGIKKSNDTVTVLFDLKNNDLIVSNNYSGPLFITDPQTQKKVLFYPGINSLQNPTSSYDPPFTMLLVIRQDETIKDESVFNSFVNNDYSIFTDNKSNLIIQSKKKIKDGIIDQQKKIIIIEFNGNNSRIFINNVLVESGKLDLISLRGILLGRNNKHNPDFFTGYFYNCGIFKSIISDEFRSALFNIFD